MNGIPRPIENANNRIVPCATVSCWEATNKIAPRIGPMQGVQPRAKAIPTKNAPIGPGGFFFTYVVFCS